MTKFNYVIIGGGAAGTTAAEIIRLQDPDGSIALISDERERLYSRVLLPNYIRGEIGRESLFLKSPAFFEDKKINFFPQKTVTKIGKKDIILDKGEKLSWDKLLIASGGAVRKLEVPGAELRGVFYLRTIDDADHIRSWLARLAEISPNKKKVVVVGGGFIGLEFATSLAAHKISGSLIIRGPYYWHGVLDRRSAVILETLLQKNGFAIIREDEAVEFLGNGTVEQVRTKQGKELSCSLVGMGIGIIRSLTLFEGSDIRHERGVITNEFLQAPHQPAVFAAGDIAEFYDPIIGRHHQMGNWTNAVVQGRIAGINMVGKTRKPFLNVSAYSATYFGIDVSFIGDTSKDDETRVFRRHDPARNGSEQIFVRNNRVVGATLINMPHDRGPLTNLIQSRQDISPYMAQLADPAFDLTSLTPDS